jgi:hypothetical protein
VTVRPALESLLACGRYAGRPAVSARVLRHRRRPHTELWRVAIAWAGGGEIVWVKRYLRDRGDAEKEWRFLHTAGARLTDAQPLAVAEPIAWLAEEATLVTREAAGEQLSRRVARAFGRFAGDSRRAVAVEGCGRAGAWLRRLHAPPVPGGDDPQRIVSFVDELLRSHAAAGAGSIVGTFALLARRAVGEEGQRVLVHGDFGAHNVFVDGDAAVAIDPSFPADLDALGNVASACEDLGRFLAVLVGTRLERTGSPVERQLARSFLDAYDEPGPQPPIRLESPSLVLFTAKHVLSNVVAWRGRLTPLTSALGRYAAWLRAVGAGAAS